MEKQKEIWKDIPNYEGRYQVSNLGRVKSLSRKVWLGANNDYGIKKEIILKQRTRKNGYCDIILSKYNVKTGILVHQLVAMAFLNHIPNGHTLVVNHKNFKKNDNRLNNLEVISHMENSNKKHLKSSSSYTGVSWSKKRKKWIAYININNQRTYLGIFKNEKEASGYYENALKTIQNGKDIEVKPYERSNKFSSKYKYVTWDKSAKKWLVQILINGNQRKIGRYKTEIEAYSAVVNFKRQQSTH